MLLIWWPDIRPKNYFDMRGACGSGGVLAIIRWRYFAQPRLCHGYRPRGCAILVTDGASSMLSGKSNDAVLGNAKMYFILIR